MKTRLKIKTRGIASPAVQAVEDTVIKVEHCIKPIEVDKRFYKVFKSLFVISSETFEYIRAIR